MSYERFVGSLRDDLLQGARRRRRYERRRTVAFAATPVLVVLAVVGALLAGRDDEGATDVRTEPGLSPSVIATCDALLDLRAAGEVGDQAESEAAIEHFVALAIASDHDELRDYGRTVADRAATPEPKPGEGWPAAIKGSNNLCRALGASGWVPTFVPAPLGPEPRVALDDYGTVVEWDTTDPGAALPEMARTQIAGRDLRPVEAAIAPGGSFVLQWSWADGRACQSSGTPQMMGSSCSYRGAPLTTEPPDGLSTGGNPSIALSASVSADVSFVVVEVGGARYVQRPALQTVIVVPDPLPADDAVVTTRAYDSDGNELACRTKEFGSRTDASC